MNRSDAVRALYAYGLASTSLRPPPGPFDDAAFDRLADAAQSDKAGGHLLAAIDDGAVAATPAQRRRLRDRMLARCAAELVLERAMLETLDVLDGVGVDARVLKGAAAAHLDHDRPWRRTFGDVDLLVRGDDFDTATGALLVAGLFRRHGEVRPGFDRRFTKGACFVRPDEVEVDLHRTFAMGPFGLAVRLDDLWDGGETFEVGGRRCFALRAEHRFLHACFHASLGDRLPKPHTLRDVAALAERPVDLDVVAALTDAWRAAAVVSWAVGAAWEELGLDPDHPVARWAATLPVTDRDLAALASYRTGKGDKFASTSIASVRWLPRWRDRAAYVYALAVPTRAYRRTRGRTQGARLRRAVGAVRHRLR